MRRVPSAHVWSAVLLGSLSLAQALAQAPIQVPVGAPWSVRSWDTRNGLPQNTVTAMLQGRDRMLWVATFGGVCRYDGVTWTVHDGASLPGMLDSRVTALLEAADGALWFGTELGFVMRFDGQSCSTMAKRSDGQVSGLARLPDGRIVCAGADDVLVVGGDGRLSPLGPARLPGARLLIARDDGLLIGGDAGLLRLAGDRLDTLHDGTVTALAVGGDGVVWVGVQAGLACLDGDRIRLRNELLGGRPAGAIRCLQVSHSGALWVGLPGEIRLVPLGEGRPTTVFRTPASLRLVYEGVSDGVWVGFNGNGLARLVPCEVDCIDLQGRDGRRLPANSVIGDGEDGFLVGDSDGLTRVAAGITRRVDTVTEQVHGLFRDADGTLWLGLQQGLGRLRGLGFERFALDASAGLVRAIHRPPGGPLLLGTDDGVCAFDGACHPHRPAAVLDGSTVKGLHPWPDGTLWVFGERGALHLGADGDTLAWLRRGQELPLDEVRAVLPGVDGRAWFATYGSGFVCRDANGTRTVSVAEGLLDPYLCTVTPFGRQWLIGGNHGPFLIDPLLLESCVDRRPTRLVTRRLECTTISPNEASGGVQPSSVAEGDVAAICSIDGLWLVERARMRPAAPPPVCVVAPNLRDDQHFAADAGGRHIVLRGNRTLVVDCVAADFDRPENIRYQWRRDAGDWSEPSSRRTTTITFSDCGEADVEFVAIDDEGRRSVVASHLRLRIEPMLWEQRWFPWAGLGAAIGIGAGVYHFGSRRSARRAVALQQLVDARTTELSSARDQLEERVARRTVELEQALQQLARDHERRLALERQVEQMQRMESLGQLAGSVAHDFNNLLTIVLGNAQLLQLEVELPPAMGELVTRLVDAGVRGRELTQRLLAMASRQVPVSGAVDLAALLRGQLDMVRQLLGPSVRVDLQLPDEPLPVLAAPGQLEQILMNLAVNAREAMPGGGTFTVQAARDGDRVRLVVADDGVGMSEEVRRRAFEPFFTTRGSQGNGIGLATVYGITKQLQGSVGLESAPGRGTRFSFDLPRATPGSTPAPQPVILPRATSSVGPRVFVIEDEPEVRGTLCRLLASWGCTVVGSAASGEHALHELGESGVAVDVVVTDGNLPGLCGVDLVQALRSQRPRLPIVFVSGHTGSREFAPALASLGIELLAKPPVREEMMAAIARAWQAAGAPA